MVLGRLKEIEGVFKKIVRLYNTRCPNADEKRGPATFFKKSCLSPLFLFLFLRFSFYPATLSQIVHV
jgi:hypothetical protein